MTTAAFGGYDPELFKRLAAIEQRSFWFRARAKLLVRAVGDLVHPGETFLEVGCGTGFLLAALSGQCGLQVTGGELFPDALEFARRRLPDAKFTQLDAAAMPYDQVFDGVGAFDVLEHIDNDLRALEGLRRAVRVGGHVFITVPQHPWLWSRFDDSARHVRRYRRNDLVQQVRQAGLTPIRVTSFVTSLLPLMALSRVRNRPSRAKRDPIADLVLPPGVDRLFERLLDFEIQLISRGADLRAGGSLFLVARREMS